MYMYTYSCNLAKRNYYTDIDNGFVHYLLYCPDRRVVSHIFWPINLYMYYSCFTCTYMYVYPFTHPWRYVAVDSLALPIVIEQLCLIPGVQTLLPHVLLHYLHVLVCAGKVFPYTRVASVGVHVHTRVHVHVWWLGRVPMGQTSFLTYHPYML